MAELLGDESMIRIIAMLGLIATPVFAQDNTDTLAKKMRLGDIMDEAAFRDMTDGNTITYNNQGDDLYREYYRPGTNRIVIEWTTPTEDGLINCDLGTWYPEGNTICFEWNRSGKVCALWVDYEGEYISELVENGERRGNIEVISSITSTPLYCEVGMVSLAAPILPAG